ncbi:adenine nucleotide translocase lysine N-methyltransferase-like isoform X1 [Bufo bufo]|uniref:adenine nucleotide translocase lysine N-methyltransferase-like isoform X1 n=1 Tax=Bufo bufo TaxID=8384 RepID=UPI001ABEE109|nr:adenine nucleotide translocase lysine N-methyltransferase-like isoform X1 [Bufo bufo]
MEDSIDTNSTKFLFNEESHSQAPWAIVGGTATVYALWSLFVLPGFRHVPWKLKVPYLPSGKIQTANVRKLLQGRKGRLVDLGSGDGRLVFAAASMGFHGTGYELNSFLINWAKVKAYRRGISQEQATFLKQDFWKADLSKYNHVTVFLAPSVVETLKKKLAEELPDNARVIVCRFPLPGWSQTCTEGSGLDQVWAYDMADVRKDSDPPLS